MAKPRVRTSRVRVVPVTERPRPKRTHNARPATLPAAHHVAYDGNRLACGRPYVGATLTDRTTRQPPEGHRLCGTCARRQP